MVSKHKVRVPKNEKFTREQKIAIILSPLPTHVLCREYNSTENDIYNVRKNLENLVSVEEFANRPKRVRGFRNWSEEQIKAILTDPTDSQTLAEKLGATRQTINNIRKRTHYYNIPVANQPTYERQRRRLSPDEVLALHADPRPTSTLMEVYKVSTATISLVKNKKIHKKLLSSEEISQ